MGPAYDHIVLLVLGLQDPPTDPRRSDLRVRRPSTPTERRKRPPALEPRRGNRGWTSAWRLPQFIRLSPKAGSIATP